jgi:hypothetical protein
MGEAQLRVEADAVIEKFKRRATKLKKDFEVAMRPVQERLKRIRHDVRKKAVEFEVDLPQRPEAAQADADESGWRFDGIRPYLEQIECYRRYKKANRDE